MTEPELSQTVGTSCSLQLGGAKSAKIACSCSRHVEAELFKPRTQVAVVHVRVLILKLRSFFGNTSRITRACCSHHDRASAALGSAHHSREICHSFIACA